MFFLDGDDGCVAVLVGNGILDDNKRPVKSPTLNTKKVKGVYKSLLNLQ